MSLHSSSTLRPPWGGVAGVGGWEFLTLGDCPLYRVRVRYGLLARVRRSLRLSSLASLAALARAQCGLSSALLASLGWRVLSCALAFFGFCLHSSLLVRSALSALSALLPLSTYRTLDLRSPCYALLVSHPSGLASLFARDYTTRPVGTSFFHHVVPPYSAGLNNCTIFNGL